MNIREKFQKRKAASEQAPAQAFSPYAVKPKKFKKLKKWIIILAVVLIAFFALKRFLASAPKPSDVLYSYQQAGRRNIEVSVNGTGTVKPNDSYNVITLVKGEILNAPFEEGDYVEKDTVLYQIDAEDVETAIEQAQLSLNNAKIQYDNTVRSVNDLDVTSAYSGKITKIYFDPNDTVPAGAVVADVVDKDTMLLKINFHSADAARLIAGADAQVTISGTGEILNGKISEISAAETSGEGGTLTRQVTISVKNPGGLDEGTAATAVSNGIACAESGTFSYNLSKSITAKVSGDVSAIYVKEGDIVSNGTKILKLKSDSLEASLKSAKLSVQNAELSLKNARDALDNYTIKAPISGTIIEKNFKAGDKVDSTNSTAVMTVIFDMSSLSFQMNIDELDIGSLTVGQEVKVTADAVEGKEFTGKIDKININGTTANGVTTYPITVVLDDFDDLLPGMNVSADIMIEKAENVLSIPVAAVNRGNTVLVKSGENEELVSKDVTLGRSDGDYIEVLSGISEGDVVAVDMTTTSFAEMLENEMGRDDGPRG